MASVFVYDAGVLIGADKRARLAWSVHTRNTQRGARLVVPAPVLAQVWRQGPRHAPLARMLAAIEVMPMDEGIARAAGELMGAAGTSDVVDAVVMVVAVGLKAVVVTSDPDDIVHLSKASGVRVPEMILV